LVPAIVAEYDVLGILHPIIAYAIIHSIVKDVVPNVDIPRRGEDGRDLNMHAVRIRPLRTTPPFPGVHACIVLKVDVMSGGQLSLRPELVRVLAVTDEVVPEVDIVHFETRAVYPLLTHPCIVNLIESTGLNDVVMVSNPKRCAIASTYPWVLTGNISASNV
jgi:hypothetical protein